MPLISILPRTRSPLMHRPDVMTSALPTAPRADMLLVLERIVQCQADVAITPEALFLALLATHRPSGLTQADTEQLAAIMISRGQCHIEKLQSDL